MITACPDDLFVCSNQDGTVLQSLCLFWLVMFDWDIIYHRQEISSLYLWETARSHQAVIMTSVLLTSGLVLPVCVSRVISTDQRVQEVCTSNNSRVMRLWVCVCVCSTYVCMAACVCSYCVITKIIKLWSLHCCCHGLKCFRKYELLFLSWAKHPIWGGLTNNSWLVLKRATKDGKRETTFTRQGSRSRLIEADVKFSMMVTRLMSAWKTTMT